MKTMNDYCRMYCLTGNLEKLLHGSMRHRFLEFISSKRYIFLDVLILAEIFEAFRH